MQNPALSPSIFASVSGPNIPFFFVLCFTSLMCCVLTLLNSILWDTCCTSVCFAEIELFIDSELIIFYWKQTRHHVKRTMWLMLTLLRMYVRV